MMNNEDIVKTSLKIAQYAHQDQVDKADIPYMYHIYGVWNRLTNYNRFIQSLGILHDLIEDTPFTLTMLKNLGYNDAFREALFSLTKRKNETYSDYIIRASKNKYGKIVKKADLEDNLYRCKLFIELHPDSPKNKNFKSLIKRYEKALLDVLWVPPGEYK